MDCALKLDYLDMRISEDPDFILDLIHSIWTETAEDGAHWEQYRLSPLDTWVEMVTPEGLQVGAIRLVMWNGSTIKMCVQIKKEYRKEWSKYAPEVIHKWIRENIGGPFLKVIAMIPDCFPNVQAFAKAAGWPEEGCITNAFKRNDSMFSVRVYGKDIKDM